MKYFLSWTERAELAVRMVLPYGVIFFLFILNIVALPWPLSGDVRTPFVLMAIYYWSLYRPTMMPVWMAFVLGIAFDLIVGVPVGLNAFVFVCVQWIVSDQRRFLMGQSFIMIWLSFVFLMTAFILLQWAAISALNFSWLPVMPALFSILAGVALLPPVYALLHLTHKILPTPEVNFKVRKRLNE